MHSTPENRRSLRNGPFCRPNALIYIREPDGAQRDKLLARRGRLSERPVVSLLFEAGVFFSGVLRGRLSFRALLLSLFGSFWAPKAEESDSLFQHPFAGAEDEKPWLESANP